MTPTIGAANLLASAVTATWMCLAAIPAAQAQPSGVSADAVPSLIRQMVGAWNVRQRMWPGPGAAPVNLPQAIAQRRLIEGMFLHEVMEPAQKSPRDRFTRIAYFNFNAVTRQYEYFSLDSRAPQMMNEKSHEPLGESKQREKTGIKLYGGSFVAPRWGDSTDVAFNYRLTIGQIERDRQVIELYLTPQAAEGAKEFLAFEYVYTRRR